MSGVSNTEHLRALIQAARDAQGWSWDDLARRCGLPKSTVHAIGTKKQRTDVPPAEILQALAKGLEVPYSRVRDAALLDAGLQAIGDEEVLPEATLLTEAMKDMTEEKRKAYLAVAIEISKAYREH